MIALCPGVKIEESMARAFYLEEFLSQLRIQGLTSDTQIYYMKFMYKFIRVSEFEHVKDFDNFIKVKFAYYGLFNREIGNNTIYKYYKCIKRYCEFLKENGFLEKVYITQIQRVKTTNPLPKAIREEDVERIRDYVMTQNAQSPFLQIRNHMLIETILYTGLRRIGLTRLKKNGVFENHIIVEQ